MEHQSKPQCIVFMRMTPSRVKSDWEKRIRTSSREIETWNSKMMETGRNCS